MKRKIRLQSFLFSVVCLCSGAVAFAQSSLRVGDFQDHPLVDAFPDSTLADYEFIEDTSYNVVLGSLQRTRGEVVPEYAERVRGNVSKLLYEVRQGFTGEEAHSFFRQQFEERGYSVQFSCEGRVCGSSNFWANDIFRNRILYGPERNQYYTVAKVNSLQQDSPYVAVYVITRGNRRVYAYLEIVEMGESVVPLLAPEVEELHAQLVARGGLAFKGLPFDSNGALQGNADISLLIDLVQFDRFLDFYVVGHLASGDGSAVQQDIEMSLLRADSVLNALVGNGVERTRLRAHGVGPLAPLCEGNDCASRIELVVAGRREPGRNSPGDELSPAN